MNGIVKLAVLGGGAFVLFGVAFVGFTQVLGVKPHQLPLIGSRFPAPQEPEQTPEEPAPAGEDSAESPPPDARPTLDESALRLGVLDSFTVRAPYSSADLETLVNELKSKRASLDDRERALEVRTKALDARAELLDDQEAQIQELRALLDAQRGGNGGGGSSGPEAGPVGANDAWTKRSQLFAEGDVDELVKRLQTYTPDDAARILAGLEPDRALELLNALPSEAEWKAFAEAYAKLPQ